VVYDILLAEDNLVNQKLAVKILEKYGHSVEIAENGHEAVESYKKRIIQSRPFDIILMDVSMPFMGGMEATELIRAYEMHNSLPPVPIIALTAHASECRPLLCLVCFADASVVIGDRERCLQAGMDDHITSAYACISLFSLLISLYQNPCVEPICSTLSTSWLENEARPKALFYGRQGEYHIKT